MHIRGCNVNEFLHAFAWRRHSRARHTLQQHCPRELRHASHCRARGQPFLRQRSQLSCARSRIHCRWRGISFCEYLVVQKTSAGMKQTRVVIFILVALAQLSVPAVLAWGRIQTLAHGRAWKFKTAPVDPEDAIRGRYIRLSYAIEEFSQSERVNWKSPIYVALKEGADGFAQIDHISQAPITGDNVVQADAGGWSESDKMHIIALPFRTYWVTEKIAPEAEQAHRNHSTRNNQQ